MVRARPVGLLDRDTQDLGLAFVAQVGQAEPTVVDPGADLGEQVGVGAGGGGVMLAARTHVGGPQRPAVRGGDDLDVPAVMVMLARPPQIHPRGRAGGVVAVGVDQGAVHDDVGVAGGLGRQQRPVQRWFAGGQHGEGFVAVVVGGRHADVVVAGQLDHPGVVE